MVDGFGSQALALCRVEGLDLLGVEPLEPEMSQPWEAMNPEEAPVEEIGRLFDGAPVPVLEPVFQVIS